MIVTALMLTVLNIPEVAMYWRLAYILYSKENYTFSIYSVIQV